MLAPTQRITPGPGQESVWDYPRPPRLESVADTVRVMRDGETIAESSRALRVLETSHPPVIYIPPGDVQMAMLSRNPRQTFCEYKGYAGYYDLKAGDPAAGSRSIINSITYVAWFYPAPTAAFTALKNFVAFYPSKVECYLADERVIAQPGDFYGGWITSRVVGPFKGSAGTMGW